MTTNYRLSKSPGHFSIRCPVFKVAFPINALSMKTLFIPRASKASTMLNSHHKVLLNTSTNTIVVETARRPLLSSTVFEPLAGPKLPALDVVGTRNVRKLLRTWCIIPVFSVTALLRWVFHLQILLLNR